MDQPKSPHTCFHCKQPSQFAYRNKLTVCKECFSEHVCNKGFRSALRNTFKLAGKTNHLVHHFDFTLNGVMVAHLLSQNSIENQKSQKKMFFDVECVFIDFSELTDSLGLSEASARVKKDVSDFKEFAASLKLAAAVVRLSEFLDLPQLTLAFKRIAPGSDYCDDFVKIVERRIMCAYARSRKIERLLLNENLEQLATRTFKLLCKSRQNEISSECSAYCEYQVSGFGVRALRPLAERSNKEVYFYSHVNHLLGVSRDTHSWIRPVVSGKPSINSLLSEFILEQQREFVATSSNIQQTIEKVRQATEDPATHVPLPLCQFCLVVT